MENGRYFGLYIKQIGDTMGKHANNNLRDKGITFAQQQMLFALRDAQGGERTLKDLEHILKIAQSSAAGLVSRLENKGFVTSYFSADDRRVKIARITDAGLEVVADTEDDISKTEGALLSGLTEEESAVFIMLLRKICRNIS